MAMVYITLHLKIREKRIKEESRGHRDKKYDKTALNTALSRIYLYINIYIYIYNTVCKVLFAVWALICQNTSALSQQLEIYSPQNVVYLEPTRYILLKPITFPRFKYVRRPTLFSEWLFPFSTYGNIKKKIIDSPESCQVHTTAAKDKWMRWR
jgi:hypothetical protein